jgi:hypothetical protein
VGYSNKIVSRLAKPWNISRALIPRVWEPTQPRYLKFSHYHLTKLIQPQLTKNPHLLLPNWYIIDLRDGSLRGITGDVNYRCVVWIIKNVSGDVEFDPYISQGQPRNMYISRFFKNHPDKRIGLAHVEQITISSLSSNTSQNEAVTYDILLWHWAVYDIFCN